jgi:hypothetical protein
MGDWGLGIGDWGLGIGPQSPNPPIPQSPNPPIPQSPIIYINLILITSKLFINKLRILIKIKKQI